ncbi:MAG: polysaccharide biosynthesis protein [Acidobacteriota bacterium]
MRFIRTRSLQLAVDALVVAIALVLAYVMRFEGAIPRDYIRQLFLILPYVIILRIAIFTIFGVYKLVWRYIGLNDLPRVFLAVGAGTAVMVAARFGLAPLLKSLGFVVNPFFSTVPFGIIAAEALLTTFGVVAARSLWRVITERAKLRATVAARAAIPKKRALLLGAGSAGVMVAREVATRPDVGFEVVGFLDDDPRKHGSLIHGYKVLGGTAEVGRFAEEVGADLAVITMASVPASAVRRIVEQAEAASLKVQIIPGLYEILAGKVNISKIRDVAIEDLLGRAPVQLDEKEISAFLTGKTILVTGAGGSIGSEMCRQVAGYRPRRLVLLDQAENPLFHIHRELLRTHPDVALAPVIGNVVDRERMRAVMAAHRPEVVIHAAAHKHVPLMEASPGEAVRNNVLGSRTVAELAHEHGAAAFVMISTDKAVNPTSVMGASKRVAELFVQALSTVSKTRMITVRFGNVLGSEGSVVPIFKEQIARGGPVTVTHPEMKRYFMTIPEASQLVLEAATMGKGGEIFVLEMGEPIPIVNLARDLIRLSGYRPDQDIKIEFSGMRPGEKLYEEINLSEENAQKTRHPRIWIGDSQVPSLPTVRQQLDALVALVPSATPDAIRAELAALVPEYAPPPPPGSPEPQQARTASGRLVALAPDGAPVTT